MRVFGFVVLRHWSYVLQRGAHPEYSSAALVTVVSSLTCGCPKLARQSSGLGLQRLQYLCTGLFHVRIKKPRALGDAHGLECA